MDEGNEGKPWGALVTIKHRPIGFVECPNDGALRPEAIRSAESRLILEARFAPAVAALAAQTDLDAPPPLDCSPLHRRARSLLVSALERLEISSEQWLAAGLPLPVSFPT